MKALYDRGLSAPEIIRMFRLIDWMTLPPTLKNMFANDLHTFEEERKMPFISPTEQLWLERGEARGQLKGIQLGLKLRFGESGLELMPRVRQLAEAAAVEAFLNAIETAPDLGALRGLLPPEPS
ncbi:MAG: hypothetical protein K2V38_15855 [Gemmataceae bacterium]|nr:hypothetical protein [Gemmataceae bacterium]